MADVQRAGRVGRDEFDLYLLAAADPRTPVAAAGGQHRADHADLGARVEGEIDESGASHLGLRHQQRNRQLADQPLGDFARVLLQRPGQLHRQVRREVPVRRIARPLKVDRRIVRRRGNAVQRLLQQEGQLGSCIVCHRMSAEMGERRLYAGRAAERQKMPARQDQSAARVLAFPFAAFGLLAPRPHRPCVSSACSRSPPSPAVTGWTRWCSNTSRRRSRLPHWMQGC